MRRPLVSRLASQRRRYTGESYQVALAAVAGNRDPLPAARTTEQQRFEADFFYEMIRSRYEFTGFPFGISRVVPEPDALEVRAESEERAAEILRFVLPANDPETELFGIPGTRIVHRGKEGIELQRLGQAVSLRLTGLPAKTWRDIEASLTSTARDMNQDPVWLDNAGWTEAERAWDTRWRAGRWEDQARRGAWCSSGLLRRIALFHTVVAPSVVSGYKGLPIGGYDDFGPLRWCISLEHRPDVPMNAQRLVKALTDLVMGLSLLRPADHLERHNPAPPTWARLDDPAATALVELRFGTGNFPSLNKPCYARQAAVIERCAS